MDNITKILKAVKKDPEIELTNISAMDVYQAGNEGDARKKKKNEKLVVAMLWKMIGR